MTLLRHPRSDEMAENREAEVLDDSLCRPRNMRIGRMIFQPGVQTPTRRQSCRTQGSRPQIPMAQAVYDADVVQWPVARWLKKEKSDWTLLVADEDDPAGTVRRVAHVLREDYKERRPNPLIVERGLFAVSALLVERYANPPGSVRLAQISRLSVPYGAMSVRPSAYVRRWWARMQDIAPAGGRIFMVTSAETARMVLEMTDGGNTSKWRGRKDEETERVIDCAPAAGNIIRMSWSDRPPDAPPDVTLRPVAP